MIVLDSSVVLAVARREPISVSITGMIAQGVMSAVNVSEVYAKIATQHRALAAATQHLIAMLESVRSFTPEQAKVAGELARFTSQAGLSLGDRACLALALELGVDVYTADRAWAKVSIGCRIHLVR